VPLHPQIIAHLCLSWARPDLRWRYRSRFLNLDDYLRAYAAWEPIAITEPPQLWLERARQEADLGHTNEAERILLEAATRFPESPPFLHFLGLLRLRRGAWVEAEQVFRFGLQRHPHHAPYHHQLGVSLASQGFLAPAADAVRTALRLEPKLKDASALLARLQGQLRRAA
jgi:uncharacterized protein HemY